ncbi:MULTISPECIES: hypothetical protein [Moorena]|uniref:Uncharacterized protein n=2 Tax=Moorena TaxID=1155738 RepID=F4XJZ8_9CYAN|nr:MULTISPECIES: hypothetical protein [Moorena]NEQ14841.1 hypothetical protein [Moorena sp. SIO3E2]EGJ34957.1 hypothetical protein LYNGBM3L_10790 [Moorena producens 3L]NEP67637.1 hypothetical protein [Moorena sp. SIO3A5]NEQ08912.1 hypothetical protein [Moorena sp. SIO4E2]NER86967.1 hypothetical protein [Moorena sp. SIO3A2]
MLTALVRKNSTVKGEGWSAIVPFSFAHSAFTRPLGQLSCIQLRISIQHSFLQPILGITSLEFPEMLLR